MREILFRGKRTDNGDWIYWDMLGHITTHTGKISKYTKKTKYSESYYYYAYQLWNRIDHSTIGQYTGLKDKNGKKIFEGDICRVCLDPEICVGKVIWDDKIASYNFLFGDGKCVLPLDLWLNKDNPVWVEVIGNIHDNPELLGGTDNG